MTDDPFHLGCLAPPGDTMMPGLARPRPRPAHGGSEPHAPSLSYFLAYWTPARIAAAKRGECSR